MSRRLVLVRHGRTISGSSDRRLGGSHDVPLCPEGLSEAQRLAAPLAQLMPARCFVSPLMRAQQTAKAGLSLTAVTPVTDPDLREIDFGRWDGMTFEQIQADDACAVERWAAGDSRFGFPGGERISDFITRVTAAGTRLVEDSAETVVAFTHAGVIRCLICHFLGLAWTNYVLFDVEFASAAVIDLHGRNGVLSGLNLFTTRT